MSTPVLTFGTPTLIYRERSKSSAVSGHRLPEFHLAIRDAEREWNFSQVFVSSAPENRPAAGGRLLRGRVQMHRTAIASETDHGATPVYLTVDAAAVETSSG